MPGKAARKMDISPARMRAFLSPVYTFMSNHDRVYQLEVDNISKTETVSANLIFDFSKFFPERNGSFFLASFEKFSQYVENVVKLLDDIERRSQKQRTYKSTYWVVSYVYSIPVKLTEGL